MLLPFFHLLALSGLLSWPLVGAFGLPARPLAGVAGAATAQPPTAAAIAAAGEEPWARAASRAVVVVDDEPEQSPKVWIGVRLTPVPAPLAAHIGKRGVMIANLVKDSPADQAGLMQYDVVVRYGEQEVNSAEDLSDAVARTRPGQVIKLGIVRRGELQTIEIRPAEQPKEREWAWKHEEPEDSYVDTALKMYGKALQLGPRGRWILRDLGPLYGWPDALKSLEDLGLDLDRMGEDLDIGILRDLDEELKGEYGAGEKVRVEVKVRVEEDGKTITVVTDEDGKIQVTRREADGTESSASYEDEKALKEADPEAYKLYDRHAGGWGRTLLQVRPSLSRIKDLRKSFQIDVEKKVKQALERAREAQERAMQKCDEAARAARDRLGRVPVEVGKRGEARSGEREVLVVGMDDSGRIRVTIRQGGHKVTHEFKNREEFKAEEPELYEQVQDLLE